MVKAGEESGKLEEVLSGLTLQMKKDHALLSKVKGALTYPLVIVVAMMGIGVLMITFVLPKIIRILTEAPVFDALRTDIAASDRQRTRHCFGCCHPNTP
jgi:type IV pilus assembly protein PilC